MNAEFDNCSQCGKYCQVRAQMNSDWVPNMICWDCDRKNCEKAIKAIGAAYFLTTILLCGLVILLIL